VADEQPDPEMVKQMTEALARGEKIQAIKIYCAATGKRLKEAQDFVDELIPELQKQDPERFAKLSESGSGCGTAVLVFVLLGVGLVMAGS